MFQKPKQRFPYLIETHINHDKTYHIRNNWLGPIFFSSGDSHTKGLLVQLHPGFEDVTEVDTDPKQRFVSFKVTSSNGRVLRVLCVYAPSEHNTREQLPPGHFFRRLQNYMENKSEGNKNKTMLEDSKLTMDKMDRDGGNTT